MFFKKIKKAIKIGDRIFDSKKEALLHYKNILNSYRFGESLNEDHFFDLIDLLDYDYFLSVEENLVDEEPSGEISSGTSESPSTEEEEITIVRIRIAEVQFKTKCFEVVYSDSDSGYISYIYIINRPRHNPFRTFSVACRSAIQRDLRAVKQAFFDKFSVKGNVPCQETGIKSSWQELNVDHRQPNTFSIIVDRFIELNNININQIGYVTGEGNILAFEDVAISEKFRTYHKEKATLRLVRKEYNLSRSSMAKIKPQEKDLKIE